MSDLSTARALVQAGRGSSAVEYARRAVAADPESLPAHQVLVLAHLHARNYEEADAASARALALAPTNAASLHNAGIALFQLGRHEDAERRLRACLFQQPDHAGAHATLALTLAAQRNRTEARFHADRAIALEPEWDGAHRGAGDVATTFKDWRTAEDHYRAALALNPEDSHTLTNLGFVLAQRGRTNEAIDASAAAARVDPSNTVATTNIVESAQGAIILYVALAAITVRGSLFIAGIDSPPVRFLALTAFLGTMGMAGWLHHKRVRGMNPIAFQAARAQRRFEGPGTVGGWFQTGWFSIFVITLAIGTAMNGDYEVALGAMAVVAVGVLVLSVVMVRRKLPRYDARRARYPYAIWMTVTIIGLCGIVAALIDLALPREVDFGIVLLGIFGPMTVGAAYVAKAKRP